MRTISYLISFLLLAACTGTPSKAPLTLWYDKPAQNWDEALPIGNGRAGAMVFGGVEKEQLQLNENTLYSGEPSVVFKDVKITPEMFDKVVGLMKAGNTRQLPTWFARTGWDACTNITNRSETCISKTTSREMLPDTNGH